MLSKMVIKPSFEFYRVINYLVGDEYFNMQESCNNLKFILL